MTRLSRSSIPQGLRRLDTMKKNQEIRSSMGNRRKEDVRRFEAAMGPLTPTSDSLIEVRLRDDELLLLWRLNASF